MHSVVRLAVAVAVLVAVASACSSDNSSADSSSQKFAITLSSTGCAPKDITAKVGKATFNVQNSGTAAVTEFEVESGGKLVGEVEDVIPGTSKSFSVTLQAGNYTTRCPGGSQFDQGSLVVSAA